MFHVTVGLETGGKVEFELHGFTDLNDAVGEAISIAEGRKSHQTENRVLHIESGVSYIDVQRQSIQEEVEEMMDSGWEVREQVVYFCGTKYSLTFLRNDKYLFLYRIDGEAPAAVMLGFSLYEDLADYTAASYGLRALVIPYDDYHKKQMFTSKSAKEYVQHLVQ